MTLQTPLAACLLSLLACTASAQAPDNITDGELELVPIYCHDVMGIRYGDSNSNTSPRAAHWVSLMGKGFWAMHHYCWARINMHRIYAPGSPPATRIARLGGVHADLFYVIKNTGRDFIMLPEIYSTLAEVELLRKSPAAAFDYVETARKLKPSYTAPYRIWGNYLASTGKSNDARQFVKTGLEFNPTALELRDLYKRLGGDPAAIVPKAAPPAASAASAASALATAAEAPPPAASEAVPASGPGTP